MTIYPYFSRHLLYPTYERFSGRNFLEKLAFLEESQWWDRDILKVYQWKKVKNLIEFAAAHNSFYQRRFREQGVSVSEIQDFSDLKKLPLLTKEDVANNLRNLISTGYEAKNLIRDNTSGSTGRNLTFYNDRNTVDWMTAAVLRNMAWYDVGFGDKRFVLWGALAGESSVQKIYIALRNSLLREYIHSSYELNSEQMKLLVRKIRQHKPKALIGYVSALEVFARFVQANAEDEIQLSAVVPAAETLFDHQRKLFQDAFHAEVFNRYGCHEFNGVAHECRAHEGMHINSENVFVEILKDGRPAAPGEMGEIVITDLHNYGAPFIRYRIEDLGSLRSSDCSCGRMLPLLDAVEGRVYDLIVCPNGTVQTGTFFCKVTRSVAGISEFQVIQESQERIRLKLVTDREFHSDCVPFLRDMIKRHCGEQMDVVFEFVKELEQLKSGKRRYVVSLKQPHKGAQAQVATV